jgi:hypothetical protein
MHTPRLLPLALALLASCSESPAPGIDAGGDPIDAVAGDDAMVADTGEPDGGMEAGGTDAGSVDAGSAVGPAGGTVERFRFAVFGDVRPPTENDTGRYPSAIVGEVMAGIESVGAQFAIATGDYMFASNGDIAGRQADLLLAAERAFRGHVFHALGNHECTGATASNCPNAQETGNVRVFRDRLVPAQAGVYYDWVVHTSMGDAHFIATAPNAWSSSQDAWLTRVLAQPARYTFVIAHEPPTSDPGPGSAIIENALRTRAGGVTLRLYGHTHDYRRIATNAIISGNAGAPLSGSGGTYGFVVVEQRADGNVGVTAYDIGRPPMVAASFVLRPDGTSAR